MRRGEISNIAAYEVWVHVGSLYEREPRTMKSLFRTKLTLPRSKKAWLFLASRTVTLIALIVGDEPEPKDLLRYFNHVQREASWADALASVRALPYVVEAVVGDPALVADGAVLMETTPERYGQGAPWMSRRR